MNKPLSSACSKRSEFVMPRRPQLKIQRIYELMMSSLRWRLLWLSMLPLMLFAFIWLSYALLQRYIDLSSQLEQRAELLARQMAVASDYAIFAQNTLVLQNITAAVVKEPEVMLAGVFDSQLQPLSISTSQPVTGATSAPILQRNILTIERSDQPIMKRVSDRLLRYTQPIASVGLEIDELPKDAVPPDVIRGYAVVEISLVSVYTELLKFLGGVLLILAGFLFIAWSVVSRFSAQLDKSLQSMADAAKKIGAGETQVRLGHSNIKVFDRLSRDLNLMAERLEFAQRDLEQKVDNATQALREQKEAAERANSAKSRFLAAASHDLRQPMHALSLLVSAAQIETNPAAQALILSRIENGTGALSDLLNSLLDISRLDGGGVKVRQEDFALESLMHRLQDTYQSLAEEKGLELMIRPTKACTHTDPALLERIMGNLLTNAIRYTPSGGAVYVAVRPRGQDWLIQVRDNGPGIALQDQETIFQEFVQLSNPQRDRSLGLGLGLAIVQRLTKLLGHQVEVRSLPGQGATFGLRIPRASLSNAGLTTDSPKATNPLQFDGLRILVVEDDELVRQSFAGLLGMWGARVEVFAQADAALAHLQNQVVLPQLIITDHRLGGSQNGLELARAIAHQQGRPVSTLLITGDTEDPILQHLSDPHIQVLYKPVKPNVLIANINRILRLPKD
jgi:signal transduction histidine kinase